MSLLKGLAIVLAVASITGGAWLMLLHRQSEICIHNVGLISMAVMNYNEDHKQPPAHLRQLVPRYLAKIPECPVAGADTYSSSYVLDGYVYCEYRSRSEKVNWQFFHF